jgi:hypothetical protein
MHQEKLMIDGVLTVCAWPVRCGACYHQGMKFMDLWRLIRLVMPRRALALSAPLVLCSGCAVVAVVDVAATVASTAIKVGATVVETTVDVTAAGARAVTGSGDKANKKP